MGVIQGRTVPIIGRIIGRITIKLNWRLGPHMRPIKPHQTILLSTSKLIVIRRMNCLGTNCTVERIVQGRIILGRIVMWDECFDTSVLGRKFWAELKNVTARLQTWQPGDGASLRAVQRSTDCSLMVFSDGAADSPAVLLSLTLFVCKGIRLPHAQAREVIWIPRA